MSPQCGSVDPLSIGGDNQDAGARYGEASVIGGDGPSSLVDPLQKGGVGQIELAFGEVDLDLGSADLQSLGRGDGFVAKWTLGAQA